MKKMHALSLAAACCLISATFVSAEMERPDEAIKTLKLSGFRIGASYLGGAKAKELQAALHDDKAVPVISQFGWQHEFCFPAGQSGLAAMVEMIGLVGGFNQGLIIPSFNVPIGIRSASGYEFGAGPHISLGRVNTDPKLSTGFVVAGGISKNVGDLNIPLNFAFMQGRTQGSAKTGYTLSILSGFAF